jgi:hypothetical protein
MMGLRNHEMVLACRHQPDRQMRTIRKRDGLFSQDDRMVKISGRNGPGFDSDGLVNSAFSGVESRQKPVCAAGRPFWRDGEVPPTTMWANKAGRGGCQKPRKKVKIVVAIFRVVYILGVLDGPCHGPEPAPHRGRGRFFDILKLRREAQGRRLRAGPGALVASGPLRARAMASGMGHAFKRQLYRVRGGQACRVASVPLGAGQRRDGARGHCGSKSVRTGNRSKCEPDWPRS